MPLLCLPVPLQLAVAGDATELVVLTLVLKLTKLLEITNIIKYIIKNNNNIIIKLRNKVMVIRGFKKLQIKKQ